MQRGPILATHFGALTQLVECHLCKVEVRGSSPLCSTAELPSQTPLTREFTCFNLDPSALRETKQSFQIARSSHAPAADWPGSYSHLQPQERCGPPAGSSGARQEMRMCLDRSPIGGWDETCCLLPIASLRVKVLLTRARCKGSLYTWRSLVRRVSTGSRMQRSNTLGTTP